MNTFFQSCQETTSTYMAPLPIIIFFLLKSKIFNCTITSGTHCITMQYNEASKIASCMLFLVLQCGSIECKNNYPTFEFNYNVAYDSIVQSSVNGFLSFCCFVDPLSRSAGTARYFFEQALSGWVKSIMPLFTPHSSSSLLLPYQQQQRLP